MFHTTLRGVAGQWPRTYVSVIQFAHVSSVAKGFLNRRNETIAAPVECLDQPLYSSVVPNRLTGSPYATGEGGFAHNPASPQLLEQFLFVDEAVAMPDQIG